LLFFTELFSSLPISTISLCSSKSYKDVFRVEKLLKTALSGMLGTKCPHPYPSPGTMLCAK
jgi:hypothetical protein